MTLRYVREQLELAQRYLAPRAHCPASDCVQRALDGLDHFEEKLAELVREVHEARDGLPDENELSERAAFFKQVHRYIVEVSRHE
jgi:hypothetical protein